MSSTPSIQHTFALLDEPVSARMAEVFWTAVITRDLAHTNSDSWPVSELPGPERFAQKTIIGSHRSPQLLEVVYVEDGVLVWVTATRGQLTVNLAGPTAAQVDAALGELQGTYERRGVESSDVTVSFWFLGKRGPTYEDRYLSAPRWSDIAKNYPARVGSELAALVAPDWRPGSGGQLLLWRGDPGTGKTYAIRALLREWSPWCSAVYITDPEKFLGDSAYMMEVLLSQPEHDDASSPDGTRAERWKLVILEDSGELLARDAKERTGQALSRLLNVTDGMIGQGLRVLLLITTNEDEKHLHDAVVRPGRCASPLTFPPFESTEASAWLAEHGLEQQHVDGRKTLAELYSLKSGRRHTPVEGRGRAVGFAARP